MKYQKKPNDLCCFRCVIEQWGLTVIKLLRFLSRVSTLTCVSTLTRDIDITILSVRPSVRDIPASDENGLTYCHSSLTVRYRNHSSFISIKHLHKIPTGSPAVGVINTGGVQKLSDYLPISCYISQTIQDSAIVTIEGE